MAAVAIPLILKRVPPNRLYGVRTRRTLRDRDVWFAANAFGGWALIIGAALSALLLALNVSPAAALVIPLLAAVAVTLVYVRRFGR